MKVTVRKAHVKPLPPPPTHTIMLKVTKQELEDLYALAILNLSVPKVMEENYHSDSGIKRRIYLLQAALADGINRAR